MRSNLGPAFLRRGDFAVIQKKDGTQVTGRVVQKYWGDIGTGAVLVIDRQGAGLERIKLMDIESSAVDDS